MCGVIGVFGHPEAANLAYLGLHALQHRGQESAGIVSSDGRQLHWVREMGHVGDIFTEERLRRLPGSSAIGHVRYSTTGDSSSKNAQPLAVNYAHGQVAVAHNGNLVDAANVRSRLEAKGSIFQGTSDTEILLHLLAHSQECDFSSRIADALRSVHGAYSLVFLSESSLVVVRDPLGIRPLSLGRHKKNGWVVASESCVFDLIEAEHIRDIDPGEMLVVDAERARSLRPFLPEEPRRCVFEWIYFARPDSIIAGQSVCAAREAMGRRLAIEHPVPADIAIAVPDSGTAAAIGYARASGIAFDQGLIRSHYIGRTFIEPAESIRHFGVKLKLSPVRDVLAGRRVVVVDDSIVRGTTSGKIIGMIRAAGAREVHLRISSPPTIGPCHYGIDTPDRSKLIASSHTVEEIRRFVGADSLGYLSLEGLHQSLASVLTSHEHRGLCDACFSNRYPIPLPVPMRSRQLRLLSV
ncbi:MAG: amidophosphoribosyltransferase [Deltaproteobacteria bacterium]|nr:amidophosphoribosyltransferase [Deltaproteobacteria bacterium]